MPALRTTDDRWYLASGALVRVLPGWPSPPLALHLVTPTTRERAARVQAFMDWADALLIRRKGPQLDTHWSDGAANAAFDAASQAR